MGYRYDFDDKQIGNLRLARSNYEIVQEGFRLLRSALEDWNKRALAHGAAAEPYKTEVDDLERMIEWGDERLVHQDATEIVVSGISIGSLRYAKAALMLMIRRRQEDRAEKASQGWPDAALRSLDEGTDRIGRIADIIKYEPSDVLWELIPRENQVKHDKSDSSADWDVFISHASEDKEEFVRPLANGLISRGLKVWYDEFTLTVGDSLRRSIDHGLARSRFGIVVISPDFMRKEWPQRELDGPVAREIDGVKVILPVWHNITVQEIRQYSPTLADRMAVSSAKGLDHVVAELIRAVGVSTNMAAPRVPAVSPMAPPSDVRLTLRGSARNARFIIENHGPGIVRNVHVEVETLDGKDSPLVKNDCEDKLPIEILRPGARVELFAALTFSTGTTFRGKWRWQEEDGRAEECSEKVSLQSI